MKKLLWSTILFVTIVLLGCAKTIPLTAEDRETVRSVYVHPDVKYVTLTVHGKNRKKHTDKTFYNMSQKILSKHFEILPEDDKEKADATVLLTVSTNEPDRVYVFASMYKVDGKTADNLISKYTGHNSFSKCHKKLRKHLILQNHAGAQKRNAWNDEDWETWSRGYDYYGRKNDVYQVDPRLSAKKKTKKKKQAPAIVRATRQVFSILN